MGVGLSETVIVIEAFATEPSVRIAFTVITAVPAELRLRTLLSEIPATFQLSDSHQIFPENALLSE